MKKIAFSLFALLISVPLAAGAGLPPWQFGMTKAQVASFKEAGPYKTFSNGDLETFNGRFHGRKENIQFFFQRGRLRRIGVYLGEGTDRKKAVATCERLYEVMQRDYGALTIPEEKSAGRGQSVPPTVHAVAATANADLFGRTHIVPVKQPKDMRVIGAVMSAYFGRQKWFYVALFFDQPT